MGTEHYVLAVLCCIHFVTCNTSSEISSSKKQRGAPECSLRQDKGDEQCNKTIKKYFFDESIGVCREFNYTGCGGNLNNFLSSDKCNSRCICSSPKDNGQGSKIIIRYFYNTETEKCHLFNYNGSGGNANRFPSLNQCQNVCERATLRRKCMQRPEMGTNCNNNSTVQYYYDKHCDCCRKLRFLGCGGNRNRFPTRQLCNQKCKVGESSTQAQPTPPPTLCFFQNDFGECNGSYTRYYYVQRLGKCAPFTYSGCGGNENNFLKRKTCKKICGKDIKVTTTVTATTISDKTDTNSPVPVTTSPEVLSTEPTTTTPTTTPPPPPTTTTTATTATTTTTTTATTTAKTTVTPSTKPTSFVLPIVCRIQPNIGFCIFNINKFYFDTRLGRCRMSIWTRCGHINRFNSQSDCEKTCTPQ